MNSTDFLDRCLVKEPSIVTREIAGELILVPVRHRAADIQCIYTTNEVGQHIWGLIDGRRTVRGILDAIVEEFEVNREEAKADLVGLLHQLAQVGAVRVI